MQNRKWGWKPSLPDQRAKKYKNHREMAIPVALPPKISIQSQMSPVENQGQLGTCVAHATAAALEFLELMELRAKSGGVEVFPDNKFDPISRLFLYYNSCAIDGDPGQDNGTTNTSMMQAIRKWGIARESLWPYLPLMVSKPPVVSAYKEGAGHLVLTDYQLDNTIIDQLKKCLVSGYPFIFGISVYSSFMSEAVAESGLVPMPQMSEELLGGHDLCCVGYDDLVAGGSFLIRNSWGTDWGLQGYCWIPYAYLTSSQLGSDYWTIRKE